ncbi:hypothetical protein GCM10010123_03250 [Pilimelia anulata]|uniref:Mini-circle protein n=1 Tax=Pilimelia anulata TaxID=53371 RepID=A0A8J3B2Q2_9ACTN|nr:DinB family protein [Pilimelia anulata]GGJ76603.1 hypothetical protein GCM10010123_03250 [Pilimelia anulata]
MTWTAPTTETTRVPDAPTERAMLDAWLEFHRRTLLAKCGGLIGEQLVLASAPPSPLTLLGLVRHMAGVERYWFRQFVDGQDIALLWHDDADPDADFNDLDPARAEVDFAVYAAEVDAARAIAARYDLDTVPPPPRIGTRGPMSVRWVLVHMIEEYARHNGHADLIRERIDGATDD